MEKQRGEQSWICSDLQVGSEFADSEWSDFVSAESTSTSAHLLVWREVISDVFGYQALYRVARRDGRVCGVLPAFLVNSLVLGAHMISVPFLNAGGICAADEAAREALLAEACSLVRHKRVRHMELRCSSPPRSDIPAREHKVRIVLDLPQSSDSLWDSLRGEIRNRTRRAQNAGLTVESASDELDGFYAVFAENMRDLGVPAHPKRFFRTVLQRFANAPKTCQCSGAELAVVKLGTEVIGGAILFRYRDTIEVPWISCSRAHFDLCPNNILYWEIMRRACDEGFRTFDFGRSSPNTGPAAFKMRWGARTEQLYWHYLLADGAAMPGEISVSNPRFQRASNLWKHAPRTVTHFLGPRLIRHLPG